MSNNNWTQALHDVTKSRHAKSESEWRKERDRLLQLIATQEESLEAALQITNGEPKPTIIKVTPETDGEATAVAVASDWHAEETVDRKTVNSLNEFSLKIADVRIAKFFENVVRLTRIERHGVQLERLVLHLGGDLMTGHIHEELMEKNGLSPTETVLWLQDRILGGIQILLKDFQHIVVVCNYGNHGRTTRKPRHATGASNSYEWMMYHQLARASAGMFGTAVEWHIADGYHLLLDVYGKTIRFHHGDGLKYQGGVGGITIPVNKAIAQWNIAIRADLDVFGHWHQSIQNPAWVCNGSLIGYNAYSVAIKAAFEPPSQTFFLFDKRYGRTGTFPIFLH
jgi:hypothetical protein